MRAEIGRTLATCVIWGALHLVTLFNAGCEPSTPEIEIDKAIELGNVDQVRAHIHHNTFSVDPDDKEAQIDGRPPLLAAIHAGRTVEIELKGFGGTFKPRNISTSEQANNEEICKLLLDSGADPNRAYPVVENRRSMRIPPLNYAASKGNLGCARQLIFAGAEVNTKHDGDSVLEYSLDVCAIDVARLLVENGADVQTDFRKAVNCMDLDLISLMASRGATLTNDQREYFFRRLRGVEPDSEYYAKAQALLAYLEEQN